MKSKIPYVPPQFSETAFNCPLCNAYADQVWDTIITLNRKLTNTHICLCGHCDEYSIWHEEKMVYPIISLVELPNDDLDNNIKADYQEAAEIVQRSSRGAAALLRLALQKLCKQLGEPGKNINTDIKNLVKRGLPVKVQESLDALRVIGNESVHPGELDIRDDIETALALFQLINFIAEKMITEHNKIQKIYEKIPDSKKKQIAVRDLVEGQQ